MKCNKCNSEWKTDASRSSSITVCPFCGESIGNKTEWKTFDNTKELLAFVAAEYGIDALFGRKYFSDHTAPLMPQKQKNLVKQAFECGAAAILQNNMNSDQAHKEIAVKQAVGKMIDNYASAKEAAERVIWEFTNALGWEITVPVPANTASPPRATPVPATPKPVAVSAPAVVSPPPVSPPVVAPPPAAKTLEFGKFDNNPIIWQICEVSADGKWAYILSKDILLQMPYNKEYVSCTWETCTLRQWLNSEFLGKFTAQEQSRIGISTIQNEDNQWYGTKGGNVTKDRIFLPSLSEVVKYFGDSGDLANKRRKDYSGNIKSDGYCIYDQYNKERIANLGGSPHWWWLRSPGNLDFLATLVDYVDFGGYVGIRGRDVRNSDGGVRPALWLNLKS